MGIKKEPARCSLDDFLLNQGYDGLQLRSSDKIVFFKDEKSFFINRREDLYRYLLRQGFMLEAPYMKFGVDISKLIFNAAYVLDSKCQRTGYWIFRYADALGKKGWYQLEKARF